MKKILIREHGREYSLMRVYAWHFITGEWLETNFGHNLDEVCLVYRGGDLVDVYYDSTYYKRVVQVVARSLRYQKKIKSKMEKFLDLFDWLKPYFLQKKMPTSLAEFKKAYENYVEFWSLVSVVYVIPVITTAGQELKEMAYSARAKTQAHNESFEPIIKGFLEKEYPQLKEKTRFVLPAEVWSGQVKNPDYLEEIKAREKGFIFYQGKLYCGQSIEQMADELGLELKEAVNAKSVAGLTGQIAQKGLVKGEVRLVSSLKDLDKVKDGDILVATNTMPKYLPAMKRAAAFVTDEGGITCHAAIVAREMKKPCVIGTKIATQVLHDGDLVEVDADNGVVKILGK